jgi:hypothetical protein
VTPSVALVGGVLVNCGFTGWTGPPSPLFPPPQLVRRMKDAKANMVHASRAMTYLMAKPPMVQDYSNLPSIAP